LRTLGSGAYTNSSYFLFSYFKDIIMKSKQKPEKTPLWISVIRLSIFPMLVSILFLPMEPTLFGFAVWKIVFYGSLLSIIMGIGLGGTAYAARRVGIDKAKSEAESAPPQPL
jgi:hypothetical protein